MKDFNNLKTTDVKELYFETEVNYVDPDKLWRPYGMSYVFPAGMIPIFSAPCDSITGSSLDGLGEEISCFFENPDLAECFILTKPSNKKEAVRKYSNMKDWKPTSWNGAIISNS